MSQVGQPWTLFGSTGHLLDTTAIGGGPIMGLMAVQLFWMARASPDLEPISDYQN